MNNALKWGSYIAVVGIVLNLVMYLAGLSLDPSLMWVRWVSALISLVLIFFGVKEKKAEDPAAFTFGKGWVATLMICLVAAVFSAIWIFIYTSAIDPDMIEMTRQTQRQAMMQAGTMTAEQIDQAMSYSAFFISPTGFAITTLLGYSIVGMVLGLIMSPVVKAIGGTPEEPMPMVDQQ